jgi:hypothetical protein
MREKIKTIQHRLEHDPKFQEAVDKLRPEWSFWGIMSVALFFFVPEIVTAIWQEPLIHWAHLHSITEPVTVMRKMYAMLEEMFRDGVSWINIGLGLLFLWWAFASKPNSHNKNA